MIGFSPFVLMADTLTISLNELRALLRKVFEGIYGHTRDWNALTDLVLWLEFYDLNGLEKLFSAEPHLGQAHPRKYTSSKGEAKIDADNGSLLELSDMIGDFLIADARRTGQAIIHIENTQHQAVIAACVARCAKAGFAAVAWWRGKKDRGSIAFQSPEESAPNLFKITLPEGFEGYDYVTVILNSSMDEIKHAYPSWFSFLEAEQFPANEIARRYEEHLDKGFRITRSDYDRLCILADRVLVEASEASRKGAGE